MVQKKFKINNSLFHRKIPNKITISAMNDTDKNIGEIFNSVNQLFQDLND